MKKILSITGLMLTALSLIQCTDDNIDKIGIELTSQPQLHVEYTPITDGSRTTTNPDGTVEWDSRDQLNVFIIEHGKRPQQITDWGKYSYKYITNSWNCKEGIFTPDPYGKQPTFYQGYSYDWYVLSPYNSNVKDPIGGADSQTSFEIGDQIQEYDQPMKHIVKSDILTAITANVMAGENPSLHLHHKGTLMKFTIQNCENKPLLLRSINLETSPDICISGKFTVDFERNGILKSTDSRNTLNLAIRNATPLEVGKTYDAYVILPPFTLKKESVFAISINSDLGVYNKTKTIQVQQDFMSGTINSTLIQIKDSKPHDGSVLIPDKNFENYLLNNFDINNDGKLLSNELEKITSIDVRHKEIKSLKGIEHLTHLNKLLCSNNILVELNLSNNPNIEFVDCSYNKLDSLDISTNSKIEFVDCSYNQIQQLNTQGCYFLKDLTCSYNKLNSLDISTNYKIDKCESIGNPKLQFIYVWDGFNQKDHSIHKSSFTKYIWVKDTSESILINDGQYKDFLLNYFDRNHDGILSLLEAESITTLDCKDKNFKSLEAIDKFINLLSLNCSNNQLTKLDLSHNLKLKELDCSYNNLLELDITNNKQIEKISCYGNKFKFVYIFDGFDNNSIANYTRNREILFITKDFHIDSSGAIINIPEQKFRDYLLKHYDFNNDQQLTSGECKLIKYIGIRAPRYWEDVNEPIIETAQGIENMTNLEYLDFSGPSTIMTGNIVNMGKEGLKELDIRHNIHLKYINCKFNYDLTKLYVWKSFNKDNLNYFNIPEGVKIVYP